MRASPKGNDPHQQSCLRIVVRAKRGFGKLPESWLPVRITVSAKSPKRVPSHGSSGNVPWPEVNRLRSEAEILQVQ
jgi:hypothetical protein